jgi:tRNA (guanine10-N2)-methyltransferase
MNYISHIIHTKASIHFRRTRPSRKGQKVRALDESLLANFEQYGLESRYLGVAVCDAALPPWRETEGLLDAVITDPPYGIREPTAR